MEVVGGGRLYFRWTEGGTGLMGKTRRGACAGGGDLNLKRAVLS